MAETQTDPDLSYIANVTRVRVAARRAITERYEQGLLEGATLPRGPVPPRPEPAPPDASA